MQNKPNLLNAQILVNCVLTMDYVNIRLHRHRQNKANQTQFKPNSKPIKPNQTHFYTICAENKPNQTQPALSAVEGPVVSMPALSKVEVSNLFQTSPIFS